VYLTLAAEYVHVYNDGTNASLASHYNKCRFLGRESEIMKFLGVVARHENTS